MFWQLIDKLGNLSPEIIVALIAGIVTVITLLYNKRKEFSIKQLQIKEEKYISFLSSLISLKANIDTKRDLNETIQVINLIGSTGVVKAANHFFELLINDESSNISNQIDKKEEQNKRYSAMLQEMRKDLYGNKSIRKFPDKLPLIIFQSSTNNIENILKYLKGT